MRNEIDFFEWTNFFDQPKSSFKMTSDVQRRCENCSATKTPIWRHGWTNEIGKKSLLCNACTFQFYI
jgi:hypothetical protein